MAAAVRSLAGRLLAVALLVSLASSSVEQKQLEELKANMQTIYKLAEVNKGQILELALHLELLGEYATLLSTFRALLKKTHTEVMDLAPFEDFVEKAEDFFRRTKTRGEAQMADMEQMLGQYVGMINIAEEYFARLSRL